MSQTTIILSALMMLAWLAFIAPNILALNRGKVLRNTALWLAIFLTLALIYKMFGPDSSMPLIHAPTSFSKNTILKINPDQKPLKSF